MDKIIIHLFHLSREIYNLKLLTICKTLATKFKLNFETLQFHSENISVFLALYVNQFVNSYYLDNTYLVNLSVLGLLEEIQVPHL